jgi:hypothetical protein
MAFECLHRGSLFWPLGNASERHSINDYFHNLKHSILVLRINLGTGSRMFFKKGIFIAGFLDI